MLFNEENIFDGSFDNSFFIRILVLLLIWMKYD